MQIFSAKSQIYLRFFRLRVMGYRLWVTGYRLWDERKKRPEGRFFPTLTVGLFQLLAGDVITDAVADNDDVVVDDQLTGYG